MFKLSTKTEIKKNIYKKAIYQRFPQDLSGKKKEKFDQDIAKITIIHEISETSVNIPKTDKVPAIFVVRIDLKTRDYLDSNIILISKLFGQNLLLVLAYEDELRLAIYENKLIVSDWQKEEDIIITLQGLNLTKIWENLVAEVGSIEVEKGNTLQDQIEIESKKEKLKKLIASTEKKARKENQAKKKFDLYKELKQYEKELEDL